MLGRFKTFILKKIYRLLIVNISFIDKENIGRYARLKTFSTLTLNSNKGYFTFLFKEDKRANIAPKKTFNLKFSGYFVELTSPDSLNDDLNPFKDLIAVVVSIRFMNTDYQALSSLLLDLYIESFEQRKRRV